MHYDLNSLSRIFLFTLLVLALVSCNRNNTELYNQAYDLEEQGKYQDAIELLTRALEIDPNDLECYNNRAWDYYELGDFDKAFSDFESMLTIDSVNTAAIYGIGYLFYEQGNYQSAIDRFNKVIELKGGGPLFLEHTNNEYLGIRVLEADIKQVYHFKKLAEDKLKN